MKQYAGAIFGLLLIMHQPASGEPDLTGNYTLYHEGDTSKITGQMQIFGQNGDRFSIGGSGWSGNGSVNGNQGYYDWTFTSGEIAGKSGKTTFTIGADGYLHGYVGGGLNWSYEAHRAQGPVRIGIPIKTAGEQLKSAAATAAANQDLRKNYDEGTAQYAGSLEPVALHPFDPSTIPDNIKKNPNFVKLNTQWEGLKSQGEKLNSQLTQIRQQEVSPGANVATLQLQEANIKQDLNQNEYDTKIVEKKMISFKPEDFSDTTPPTSKKTADDIHVPEP